MKLIRANSLNFKTLQKLCLDAYVQNFANHWEGNGLKNYLEKEFGDARLKSDLETTTIGYYLISYKNENVGFAKVNFKSADFLSTIDNCELDKVYILPKYKGLGLGKFALKSIISEATQRNKKQLFLSVIDKNTSAIVFYKKIGFTFHSKTRLEIPNFKEELKGMHRMVFQLT